MSLAVRTSSAPIRLVGFDGSAIEGSLFLHDVGDRASRAETISERLEGDDFLPVRIGERVELVHLAWIAYVAVSGRDREVALQEELGGRRAPAQLELSNGETLAGDLLYALPSGRSRISDLLNRSGRRFLLLLTEEETLFVHRAAIRRARETRDG